MRFQKVGKTYFSAEVPEGPLWIRRTGSRWLLVWERQDLSGNRFWIELGKFATLAEVKTQAPEIIIRYRDGASSEIAGDMKDLIMNQEGRES